MLLMCDPPEFGGFNEKLHFIHAERNSNMCNLNLNVAIIRVRNANFQLSSPPLMLYLLNPGNEKASLTANCLQLRTLSRGTTLVYNLITEITSHVQHKCDTLGTIMGAPNVF